MGSPDEQLPFGVEWRHDGFVASMDDPAPGTGGPETEDIRSTLTLVIGMALMVLPVPIAGVTSVLMPEVHLPISGDWLGLGYWLGGVPAALLALHLFTSRRLRAVLECGPERVIVSRTLRRRRSLDTRRITSVIPGAGGLHIAAGGRHVWVPCPDAHLEELVADLTEALRRYASFEGDMEQPEVIEASKQARSILARKPSAEREG